MVTAGRFEQLGARLADRGGTPSGFRTRETEHREAF
jgi:hypothetical protein